MAWHGMACGFHFLCVSGEAIRSIPIAGFELIGALLFPPEK